jgi:hypothetical protein
MTDDLIKRLRDADDVRGWNVRQDAADRIEELEKARDMWMERVDVVSGELDYEQEGSLQLAGLLKKAEADLAAARAALRFTCNPFRTNSENLTIEAELTKAREAL